LTVQTKTYSIQKCQDVSAGVSANLTITWNGDVQSANVSGTLKAGYIPLLGVGDPKGAVRVNGNEIGTFDMTEIAIGTIQGTFNFDIKNYLTPGTNTFDVWIWFTWGGAAFYYTCWNDGSITVTADEIRVIPPTSTTDYIRIAIIGGLIVAAIAVVGYSAGKIAPKVRHRRES